MLAYHRVIWLALCLFFMSYANTQAATTPSLSLDELLQEVQQAARELDYSGVLSYSNSTGVESMSLVHVVDGTGERERLAVLDGMEREFLRDNDITQCLIPAQKLVIIEKARADRFPALLSGQTEDLTQFYDFSVGETQRVAGRECQEYALRPIDHLRYGYNLCIDKKYHLLLKLQTIATSPTDTVINQVAFASVSIGEDVVRDALETSWKYNDWKTIAANMEPTNLAEQGWRIPYPDGFVPVTEVNRFIRSERQVAQLVLSDGLASISVFIEPVDKLSQRLQADTGSKNGSIHLFRKRIGEYWLTATGETPLETLHYLGNNTEFVPVAK